MLQCAFFVSYTYLFVFRNFSVLVSVFVNRKTSQPDSKMIVLLAVLDAVDLGTCIIYAAAVCNLTYKEHAHLADDGVDIGTNSLKAAAVLLNIHSPKYQHLINIKC